MTGWKAPFLAVALVAFVTTTASAAPILYSGVLAPNVPVNDVNTQPSGSFDQPIGAEYWSFFATAGTNVTVTGARLALH